jgi:hypothetical protein
MIELFAVAAVCMLIGSIASLAGVVIGGYFVFRTKTLKLESPLFPVKVDQRAIEQGPGNTYASDLLGEDYQTVAEAVGDLSPMAGMLREQKEEIDLIKKQVRGRA